jgi:RNase H-fold protein (predicted Holliday junction resolvase)
MRRIAAAVILSALSTTGAAWAQPVSTLLDHHVANMKSGSLNGVMADYAADAVVVTPAGMVSRTGVFTGRDVRKLFAVLTDKDHVPGNKTMQTRYETVSPDTTIMHWVQFKGTRQEVSGYDVFVVRGGKVAFQAVIVNPPK